MCVNQDLLHPLHKCTRLVERAPRASAHNVRFSSNNERTVLLCGNFFGLVHNMCTLPLLTHMRPSLSRATTSLSTLFKLAMTQTTVSLCGAIIMWSHGSVVSMRMQYELSQL